MNVVNFVILLLSQYLVVLQFYFIQLTGLLLLVTKVHSLEMTQ